MEDEADNPPRALDATPLPFGSKTVKQVFSRAVTRGNLYTLELTQVRELVQAATGKKICTVLRKIETGYFAVCEARPGLVDPETAHVNQAFPWKNNPGVKGYVEALTKRGSTHAQGGSDPIPVPRG